MKDAVGPGARTAWLAGAQGHGSQPHSSERDRPDRLLDTTGVANCNLLLPATGKTDYVSPDLRAFNFAMVGRSDWMGLPFAFISIRSKFRKRKTSHTASTFSSPQLGFRSCGSSADEATMCSPSTLFSRGAHSTKSRGYPHNSGVREGK